MQNDFQLMIMKAVHFIFYLAAVLFVIYPIIKYRKEMKINKVPLEILRGIAVCLILGIYINAYDLYRNLGETVFFWSMTTGWTLIIIDLSILIKYRDKLHIYDFK